MNTNENEERVSAECACWDCRHPLYGITRVVIEYLLDSGELEDRCRGCVEELVHDVYSALFAEDEDAAGVAAATTEEELYELLTQPVVFPPNIEVLNHCCPELEYRGKTEAEATFDLELKPTEDGAWREATCEFCQVTVRSRLVA